MFIEGAQQLIGFGVAARKVVPAFAAIQRILRNSRMLPSQVIRAAAAALLTLAAVAVSAQAQAKPRIEKAADLPRFSYKIDARLEDVVRQPDLFAPLMAAIKASTSRIPMPY